MTEHTERHDTPIWTRDASCAFMNRADDGVEGILTLNEYGEILNKVTWKFNRRKAYLIGVLNLRPHRRLSVE